MFIHHVSPRGFETNCLFTAINGTEYIVKAMRMEYVSCSRSKDSKWT